jgi:uncharacterized DUF497 family protein
MLDVQSLNGFDWDEGNPDKNWLKNRVSTNECEEVFFNVPLFVADDVKHSQTEQRYFALGQTNGKRLLFLSFVIRADKIRIISARDMHRKERKIYAEATS